MKKYLLLLFIFQNVICVQGQITFQKGLDGIPHTQFWGAGAYCVMQTSDSGYFVAGSIVYGNSDPEFFWARTDSTCNFLWFNVAYGGGKSYLKSAQQTSDGGFILCGYVKGNSNYDIMVIKLDINGVEQWRQLYDGTQDEFAFSIKQTFDGGYIICGSSGPVIGAYDLIIIKTDVLGNEVWSKVYPTLDVCWGRSIQQTSDSGYIMSSCVGGSLFLLKTDSIGGAQWSKAYNDGWSQYSPSSVEQTFDGGYIVAGFPNAFGGTHNYSFLIKTNSVGDTLWTKSFGGIDTLRINCVLQTADSGYILVGSIGIGAYLIKTDSNGDTLWTRVFPSKYEGTSVQQTYDGGYIISCTDNLFLIKTDANGNTSCYQENHSEPIDIDSLYSVTNPGLYDSSIVILSYSVSPGNYFCDTVSYELCLTTSIADAVLGSTFSVSPNPTSSTFTISSTTQLQNAQIEIYNLLGEKMYLAALNSKLQTVDCKLNSGIYFVKVQSEKGSAVQKLIVQ